MSTEPEAIRLAGLLDNWIDTYPQASEDEPGGYATEFDQLLGETQAELRRLHAENESLKARNEVQFLMVTDLRQQAKADEELMREVFDALGDTLRTLCWLAFGECRNITNRPLLTAKQAEAKAIASRRRLRQRVGE